MTRRVIFVADAKIGDTVTFTDRRLARNDDGSFTTGPDGQPLVVESETTGIVMSRTPNRNDGMYPVFDIVLITFDGDTVTRTVRPDTHVGLDNA